MAQGAPGASPLTARSRARLLRVALEAHHAARLSAQGFGRKGAALHGQGQFDKAIAAYEEGLKIDPALAMLTNGLADAKKAAEQEEAGGMGQLGNVFSAPDVMQKIAANPQTAPLLMDPSFMQKIEELKRDPNSISKHLGDQRILSVMGMLMGVNIQTQVVKLDSN